jgi:hypothetical protein
LKESASDTVRILSERSAITALAATAVALAGAGCGLNVTSPDLFLLTRTPAARSGPGGTLALLVSDDGTIRCNSGPRKLLPDKLLLEARDLTNTLDQDAKARLHIPGGANSVYSYEVKLKDGTISFGDTAASRHPELAGLERFTLEAAQGPCGQGG